MIINKYYYMFNKKLMILILLAIFCIGASISSVSANENSTNLIISTEISDENHDEIIEKDDEDIISEYHLEEKYSSMKTGNDSPYFHINT